MTILRETIFFMTIASIISLSDTQHYIFCSYFASPRLLTASTTGVGIVIPNDGADTYEPNQDCKWIITTNLEDNVIEFDVRFRELEGPDVRGDCVSDYVDIFDVNKNDEPVFLDRFCEEGKGLTFYSSGPKMIVQFISSNQFQYRGFLADYKSVYRARQEHSESLGLGLGITTGILLIIAFICLGVIVHRVRKRKLLERSQMLFTGPDSNQTVTNSSSPFTSSAPPQYGSDATDFAANINPTSRSSTPPPAYETIVQGQDVVTFDTSAPEDPPSYETVLRESFSMDHSGEISTQA